MEQKRPDETNERVVNNWGNWEMEKRNAPISHESSLIGRVTFDLPPRRSKTRNPLNREILAWVVYDGTAKGVSTPVRGLLVGAGPLSFAPDWAVGGLMRF